MNCVHLWSYTSHSTAFDERNPYHYHTWGFGAANEVKFRYFGRFRDYVSTWIAKPIDLSGRTWPNELRPFVELDISFDGI